MKLNHAQFLAALQQANGSVSVAAGLVTFENGDTFDVAEHSPSDTEQGTPLEAARALAAIHKNEPAIVDAFRGISQRERNHLAAALSAFYPVLVMENKYQPVLLDEPIKIPVTTYEEGLAVQRALFALGCGFHHGSYPLAKDISDECTLSGIFVSRKGVMTVMPFAEKGSVDYVANHKDRAVSPATVLEATTLAELLGCDASR